MIKTTTTSTTTTKKKLEVSRAKKSIRPGRLNRCSVRSNNENAAQHMGRAATWMTSRHDKSRMDDDVHNNHKAVTILYWKNVRRGLPRNRGCRRTGRLCARSCTVPRRPGRSPPVIRSPAGCRTPKSTCSDGYSTASRTVAAAAADGDPWRDGTWCAFDGGYNIIMIVTTTTTTNSDNIIFYYGIVQPRGRRTAADRLKKRGRYCADRTCLAKTSTLQNATTTTATSSRREDDLLCAFACAQHIHTHAHTHARTDTRTRKHETGRAGRLC